MSAQGTTTINFGAFPGSPDASVALTGHTGIAAGSLVDAWVFPAATDDHSVAEHYIDPPVIIAGEVVAGTGFTIRGFSQEGGIDLLYGAYNVAWVWN